MIQNKPICKNLIFLLLITFGFQLNAQTAAIYYKNQSGNMAAFHPQKTDNFGLVPVPETVKVEWLSDTSFHQFRKLGNEEYHDTLYEHHHFLNDAIDLDSLQTIYPRVEFMNYHFRKKENKTDRQGMQQQQNRQIRSSAFLLFIVTFGIVFSMLYVNARS